MRSRYKIIDEEGLYFITSTIVEWIPVFTRANYFQIITDSLSFCRQNKGLQIFAYVVMDNHLHLIVSSPNLSEILRDFKSFTAKEILKLARKENKRWLLNQLEYYKKRHKKGSTHQVWQEGVHPQKILSETTLREKLNYIHNNPVRAGYVEKPEHWIYSSATNYLVGRGFLEIDLYKF